MGGRQMTLELTEVKRIAADVARAQDPSLEVVGATTAQGNSAYTEVTVTINGCSEDPCRVVIGANRSDGEPALREAIAAGLRTHLQQHRK